MAGQSARGSKRVPPAAGHVKCRRVTVKCAPPQKGRGNRRSGFRRPDGTPAGTVNQLARKYLAGTPCVSIRTLDERAIGAALVSRRVCSRRRINSTGVVNVFQGLCDRIAFFDMRHILGARFPARAYYQTCCRDGGQLHELTSCDLTQSTLLTLLIKIRCPVLFRASVY
jgi:hypothetical protein